MGQTLELNVKTPAIMPKGITRRQWRLASLLPQCETAYEALVKAGYSPKNADKNGRPILGTLGLQRAIVTQTQAKLDSARSINGITAAKLRSRIEDDSASDQLILGAYKVTTDAIVAGADEVETVSEADRQDATDYMVRFAARLLVASASGIILEVDGTIKRQVIEQIALAAEKPELTEYTLSDATPQTPTLMLPEVGMTIEATTVACTHAKRGPGRPRTRS